jgi:hypothetical protein
MLSKTTAMDQSDRALAGLGASGVNTNQWAAKHATNAI